MPTTIEELQVEISSSANDVDKQIDSLVKMLDKLQKTLSGTGGGAYKKYTSGTKTATNETKKLSSEVKKVNNNFKQTEKTTDSLARSFGKFYANYFLLIRALKGTWDSVESTADYVESFNYFTVSIGKIASRWDDQWTNYADENARNYSNRFYTTLDNTFKKLSGVSYSPDSGLLSETGLKNLGLNLQEVTQYAAQLSSMMDSVGQSGETTLATTNAFVKLAGDISSLYNIYYSEAASKMRSVLQGQSRAGYGFGWDTTVAALQATADRLDLSKPVSEMTQMEKQQLRILTILEQSRVAWGDQANTINTVANQIRLLKNNLKETSMLFGQLFIPILQKVIPYVNGFTIAVKRLLANISGLLGIKIEDIGQGFGGANEELEDTSDELDNIADSAKKAKASLRGFDELKTITTPKDSQISMDGLIDLSAEIEKATQEFEITWQTALENMKNKAEEIADTIYEAFRFKDIAEGIGEIKDSIVGFSDAVKPFSSGFGEGLIEYFSALAGVSLDIFTGSLNSFSEAIGLVPEDLLKKIGKGLGKLMGSVVAIAGIKGIYSKFNNFSRGLSALGKTLLSNPILSTFALATGILTLIEMSDQKAELKASIDMGDLITDLDALKSSMKDTSSDIKDLNDAIMSIDSSELGLVYGKWIELNDKVSELTDEETGLLKAYADRIKELFPEAKRYIDDNGKAYQGLAEELDAAINKAILLSSIQAADDLRSDAVKVQLQAEMDLASAEKSVDEIFMYFKDKFPELTDEEISGMLNEYAQTGNMFVRDSINRKSPIEVAKERSGENGGAWDWIVGDVVHYQELQKLKKEADKYVVALNARSDAEKQLVTAKDTLNKIIEKSIELDSLYSRSIGKAERKTQSFNFTISETASKYFPKFIEQLEISKSKTDEAKSALEKLNSALGSINGKKVVATVSLNTEGEVVSIKKPNLVITPYATGGFPEDGLFMANHNELVGKFSNGRTAVANNEQITQGIADAVYPAVYNAVTAAFSNKGTEPIRVFVGDRELTDIVVDGINQRTRAGKQPLYGW